MRIGIVGGGLTGFVAYLTLRTAGIAADEIEVFSPEVDPAAAVRELLQPGDVVLVKGSRSVGLEAVAAKLTN